MADPAARRMSLEEFLAWNGEMDVHYELYDGAVVAMAPPAYGHGVLAGNLSRAVGNALPKRPPCRLVMQAGLLSPSNARSFYEVDMLVSCTPAPRRSRYTPDPVLIIEILSPSTADIDRRIKLGDYRAMPSVREVVLIDSEAMYCEVHRRFDGDRWLTDLLRTPDSTLRLDSIGFEARLGTLYEGVPLEE